MPPAKRDPKCSPGSQRTRVWPRSISSSGVWSTSHLDTSTSSALRRRQPHGCGQLRGQKLIGQHAHVLRIIAELDHVDPAVSAQHQLALRAAPHAPDVLYCLNRQIASLPLPGFSPEF